MVHQLNIEDVSRVATAESPTFAVVAGGKSAAAEPTLSPPEIMSAGPAAIALPYSDKSTLDQPYWRHASFERALNGLLADIDEHTAPVVVLTGDAGTGKTLLVQCLISRLGHDAIPVLHTHPHSSFQGFLGSVCRQLRLADSQFEGSGPAEDRFDLFWNFLRGQAAEGKHLVVFVDNAHDMPEALLEELALLSRWTEADKRVLQIVLVGLPSLHDVIEKLVQRQLIADGYPSHGIAPLEPDETSAFVCSRLSDSGAQAASVIAPEAIDRISTHSRGIPRTILTLCSLAELNARLEGRGVITPELVDQVAHSAMVSGQTEPVAAIKNDADEGLLRPEREARSSVTSVSYPARGQEEHQMTRLEDLTKILKNLQNRSPGIEASALISEDGLMIASALSSELDDTRVGGMTATLLSLGTRAAAELHRGEVKEVIVRGENGYAVMVSAGSGTLLLVLTTEETKLGLIFFDMREAIKGISKVLFR